jgi:hypothetical protein
MRPGSVAREIFGDEFVDHYGGTRVHEVHMWNQAVTNWEGEQPVHSNARDDLTVLQWRDISSLHKKYQCCYRYEYGCRQRNCVWLKEVTMSDLQVVQMLVAPFSRTVWNHFRKCGTSWSKNELHVWDRWLWCTYRCYLPRHAVLRNKGGDAAARGAGSGHAPLDPSIFHFKEALDRNISSSRTLLFYFSELFVSGQVNGDGHNHAVRMVGGTWVRLPWIFSPKPRTLISEWTHPSESFGGQ